ncbi:hypothetical protein SAMN05444817_10968 [Corynebacterium appendicis CIP 107643]|uniref:Uncharacterized protein n=1 Tax=Corynebacterium appendicis CIP 107643 TaxID=1161099 RepID=A0A1N7JLT2_9CORY|nr:hypothetical protein [Corynebacterium appendicis]WJY61598.1 hypothetical protein CAPP_08460 [Corynebacterium appendicis CIP 107643]SIS50270.1 hypothetical protein SAMN05444817_10968 [Corynebacterium appendicis CIP 107643]
MHYVSWDRADREAPVLVVEDGPNALAKFTHERAELTSGEVWQLVTTPEGGAVARADDGRDVVRADGSLRRDKQIPVTVGDRRYVLVAESSKNWIIDDEQGQKVAQFTSDHNGVRRSILEFEGETDLDRVDIVALAWVSRLVLEARKMINSTALIAFLVLLSVFIVAVWFIGPR